MTLFTQVERNLPYLTERYVGLAPNGTIGPLMCGAEVLAANPVSPNRLACGYRA
jgi:hypothetical protein